MKFYSIFVHFVLQLSFLDWTGSAIDIGTHVDPIQLLCTAVNLLPIFTHYQQEKVGFLLWTRNNAGDQDEYKLEPFNSASLSSSPFNGALKTYIVIHGYRNFPKNKNILQIKTKILNLEEANIFSIGYSELVKKEISDLEYAAAVCNAYKVGNFSAYVFNWLSENSELDSSRIHIIGGSLGAHVAGVMAHYMITLPIGKVSRITGLDPAGVLFSPGLLNSFRLDKYQADFVDIIHTNGCDVPVLVCIGISEVIGHVDFFPNGGVIQPGCNITDVAVCSHGRSILLYIESIKPVNLEFKSWPCSSSFAYYTLKNCTSCNDKCLNMGFHVSTEFEGKYFLSTNGEPPYAKGDQQF